MMLKWREILFMIARRGNSESAADYVVAHAFRILFPFPLAGLRACVREKRRTRAAVEKSSTPHTQKFGYFPGLGCPDWPGCYGRLTPAQAASDIERSVAAQGGEHGPVSSPRHGRKWATAISRQRSACGR